MSIIVLNSTLYAQYAFRAMNDSVLTGFNAEIQNELKGKTEKEMIESGIPQEVIDNWKRLNP